jgi:hypothetical protein
LSRLGEDAGGASAATDARSSDPKLQGRTYAIPFETVWTAAMRLADGGLRRWHVLEEDDQRGVILAVATSAIRKRVSDVRITVGLDANGQTRVDLRARTRDGKGSPRHDVRRIDTFLRHLDQQIEARQGLILDAAFPSSRTS